MGLFLILFVLWVSAIFAGKYGLAAFRKWQALQPARHLNELVNPEYYRRISLATFESLVMREMRGRKYQLMGDPYLGRRQKGGQGYFWKDGKKTVLTFQLNCPLTAPVLEDIERRMAAALVEQCFVFSPFAKAAKSRHRGVQVLAGRKLLSWFDAIGEFPPPLLKDLPYEPCACGAPMGERVSRAGRPILVCTLYPDCRNMKEVEVPPIENRQSTQSSTTSGNRDTRPLPSATGAMANDDMAEVTAFKSDVMVHQGATHKKLSLRETEAAAMAVLNRALSIARHDGVLFPPLMECQAKVWALREEIQSLPQPAFHPAVQDLLEGKHAIARLLQLVEHSAEMSAGELQIFREIVAASFGDELAAAAVNGQLDAKPSPLSHSSPPVETSLHPINKEVPVESSPEPESVSLSIPQDFSVDIAEPAFLRNELIERIPASDDLLFVDTEHDAEYRTEHDTEEDTGEDTERPLSTASASAAAAPFHIESQPVNILISSSPDEVDIDAAALLIEESSEATAPEENSPLVQPREFVIEDSDARAIEMENRANEYLAQGDHSQAERLYERLLPLQEKAFGLHDPSVLRTLRKLSELRGVADRQAYPDSPRFLEVLREYLPWDCRKVEIARLKRERPDTAIIQICVELDRLAVDDPRLKPLLRWHRKTNSWLWIDNYRSISTHSSVSNWVNRITPSA